MSSGRLGAQVYPNVDESFEEPLKKNGKRFTQKSQLNDRTSFVTDMLYVVLMLSYSIIWVMKLNVSFVNQNSWVPWPSRLGRFKIQTGVMKGGSNLQPKIFF